MGEQSEEQRKAAEAAQKAAQEAIAAKQAAEKAAREAAEAARRAEALRLSEIKNAEEKFKKAMPTKDSLPPIKPKDEPKTDEK